MTLLPAQADSGAGAEQQLLPPGHGSALARARWHAAVRATAAQLAARRARSQARLVTLRQLNRAHLAMRARLLLARIAELVALQAPPPAARTGGGSGARSTALSQPLAGRGTPRGALGAAPSAEEVGGQAYAAPGNRLVAPPGLPAGQAGAEEQPSILQAVHAPTSAPVAPRAPQPCSNWTGSGTSAATGRPSTVDTPVTPRSAELHPCKRPRPASAPQARAGEDSNHPALSQTPPHTVPALRSARGASALASLRTPRSARGPRGGGTAGAPRDAAALAAYREELALVLSLLSPFLGGLPGGPLRALCVEATAETAVSGQARGRCMSAIHVQLLLPPCLPPGFAPDAQKRPLPQRLPLSIFLHGSLYRGFPLFAQIVASAGEPQRAWHLVLTGTLELTLGASSRVPAAAAPGHRVSLNPNPSAPVSALSLARARLRAAAAAASLSASARAGAGLARSGNRQCPFILALCSALRARWSYACGHPPGVRCPGASNAVMSLNPSSAHQQRPDALQTYSAETRKCPMCSNQTGNAMESLACEGDALG